MFKARVLFFTILGIFALIYLKLFYIQVMNEYASYGNDYLKTRQILPERGKIFDRNHEPLAVNQVVYRLFAEPKKIEDRNKLIKGIEDVLHIGEATLEARIDPSKVWAAVANAVTANEKKKLESLQLKGIGFDEGYKRYYPEASLAAHLLGFVGKRDNGEDVGYFGVEGYYDKDLAGLGGLLKSERDVMGNPILIGMQEKLDVQNGRDLMLTIDKTVQDVVKQKLKNGIERYQAKDGCVIVAKPTSMEILALSCLPDFDADNYFKFGDDVYRNAAISNVYEPGSTFKPLVVASAIEQKAIKPDDTYYEDGPVKIGEYSIKTWNDKYGGKMTITNVLERSSNVGMVNIGRRMGDKKLLTAIKRFGFGELTGIDLQGEVPAYLRAEKDWYPIDYATATFGQGIAVTPIQMITAFSSIINGGILYRPTVIRATVDEGKEAVRQPEAVRRIVSEKTSAVMRKMLESTVENGEFKWAKPEGYRIGGKTGTAQIPIEGKYDPYKTVASFIGFSPVDNPQFIAIVILRETKTSPWGSETAAPLFFDIAKELLVYYNIPPNK